MSDEPVSNDSHTSLAKFKKETYIAKKRLEKCLKCSTYDIIYNKRENYLLQIVSSEEKPKNSYVKKRS